MNRFFRFLLWPLGLLYGFGVWLRNKLFDFGVFKSQKGAIKTVVIGNLAIGGTGKTPHTDFLIQKLRNRHKLAILSRGYGRKTKGYYAATQQSTAGEIGDEPLLLFRRNPGIPFVVCENRLEGLAKIKQAYPDTELVILDDAFQHRRLIGDIRILLTDFSNPWWDDFYLPAGSLRDHRGQYKRAHGIVVTKCPPDLDENQMNRIKVAIKPLSAQKVFFTRVVYGQPIHFHGPSIDFGGVKNWLGVAGIASPKPFFQYIENEYGVKSATSFADHHIFSHSEIEMLASKCGTFGHRSAGWLTTEKDAMRLMDMDLPQDIPMFYIPISISFAQGENEFDTLIENLFSGNT